MDRRRQIIEGTLEAIRGSSVADIPLGTIAERAGMRANHVLYYFASRDDVLVAAAAHVEKTLAEGRAERLRAIPDPVDRLRAFVTEYLPDDRHDPAWKLWVEGWLRSTAHSAFAEVGEAAHAGWHADLVATVEPFRAPEDVAAFARRMLFMLDGLAIHVVGGHLPLEEAIQLAMTTLLRELGA
ncbi:TetR/AcrR family transcriptional regulator [Solirubrobacter sp. CPCC 204708]|uniref:TetR/AcrR family transcriptional regulator n=1 Tax=Solirubrobacter deserti TaxID=2282478 RepID=A0ABT4RTE1_9ACTN|nr:TetR/AcrR family transcriptional regulator [Solirubrobacter deserti]MBE2320752.1 TetR/AcrR family transcriptional regulator [Solirubrobacter deserti]MDA0141854.1 TetR/AcrR family transcriptional regulator [Solirubrobacter deserti]